ncbi:hydrolytic protein [Embleya sp. NPDC127516]|uniref:COG1470 family protein n=1 Tax=Embleya sp. NPDC127516 TaxID=3363990 RepID=UPI0037FE6788
MTTPAEIEIPPVTVSPGGEATTTLTVRNDSDIVEAYALEVVGDCAAWSTVEPARVSLYPGTSEEVTIRLAPPRSPEVRAGEIPLGVRVLPAEHPESVVVPETTVVVEAFRELRAELDPRRRRGWLEGRYRVAVRNQGNTAVDVALVGRQAGEELALACTPERLRLAPGESAEARLRVRARKLIWFGASVTWAFEAEAGTVEAVEAVAGVGPAGPDGTSATASGTASAASPEPAAKPGGVAVVEQPSRDAITAQPVALPGEFVQLPVLPKWLLILLAVLLALLVAWFALVRPSVRSTAKQAGTKAAEKEVARDAREQQANAAPNAAEGQGVGQGESTAPANGPAKPGASGGSGTGTGTSGGAGRQSSATIDVQTDGGADKAGTYRVPDGNVFAITDIVVSNFQGDEGLVTISFGEQKITTIALETFRNQDYHWVTPIQIPANATVTAAVTCAKPGTPATGQQAAGCHEVLNVSGVLSRTQ